MGLLLSCLLPLPVLLQQIARHIIVSCMAPGDITQEGKTYDLGGSNIGESQTCLLKVGQAGHCDICGCNAFGSGTRTAGHVRAKHTSWVGQQWRGLVNSAAVPATILALCRIAAHTFQVLQHGHSISYQHIIHTPSRTTCYWTA
jgi:hypothetical protein